MKGYIKTFVISVMLLTLTGCWNLRDLTDLAIMTGVAIDKTKDNYIEMTVQIVKPEAVKTAMGSGGSSASNTGKAYVNVTSYGKTMFEAARNLLAKLNKKAYFAQVQLIVISEDAARDGISNYFDLFERDAETRGRADIMIAKGMKAKTVLEAESRLTKLPTTHNVEALRASKRFGKIIRTTSIDVLKSNSMKGNDIVLPVIYNNGQQNDVYQEDLIMEGTAVIRKDKLVGFFDAYQTRGYLFAKSKLNSTIINVPSPLNPEKAVSIEVIRSRGKIEAKMNNGKPVCSIEVKTEGNIGEQQEAGDLTKPDTIKALESETENEIRDEIINTVKISQKEYQSDVFGFINDIYKNYYSEWKGIVDNWPDIYSKTAVNVKVKFKIRSSGLIKEPSKPK